MVLEGKESVDLILNIEGSYLEILSMIQFIFVKHHYICSVGVFNKKDELIVWQPKLWKGQRRWIQFYFYSLYFYIVLYFFILIIVGARTNKSREKKWVTPRFLF
jgi:hypothetical protein